MLQNLISIWQREKKLKWLEGVIEQKNTAKAINRRKFSLNLMSKYPGYKCKDCIHKTTKQCTDQLENGCEHYYNIDTKKSFPDFLLKRAQDKRREWMFN